MKRKSELLRSVEWRLFWERRWELWQNIKTAVLIHKKRAAAKKLERLGIL